MTQESHQHKGGLESTPEGWRGGTHNTTQEIESIQKKTQHNRTDGFNTRGLEEKDTQKNTQHDKERRPCLEKVLIHVTEVIQPWSLGHLLAVLLAHS